MATTTYKVLGQVAPSASTANIFKLIVGFTTVITVKFHINEVEIL